MYRALRSQRANNSGANSKFGAPIVTAVRYYIYLVVVVYIFVVVMSVVMNET